MAGSDFYLNEKGNYDEYYFFLKNFLAGIGYEYYDFNLCKEKYIQFQDSDFSDDNHLNKAGVAKYTPFFCDFFMGKLDLNDLFYSSYKEKMDNQADKIFGLILNEREDKKSLDIIAVANHVSMDRITYDVYLEKNGESFLLYEKTNNSNVIYPNAETGLLRVVSYMDGVKQTTASRYFTAL